MPPVTKILQNFLLALLGWKDMNLLTVNKNKPRYEKFNFPLPNSDPLIYFVCHESNKSQGSEVGVYK